MMYMLKRVNWLCIYNLVLSAGLGPRRLGSCSEKLEASAELQMWAACRTGQSQDGSPKGRESCRGRWTVLRCRCGEKGREGERERV